jgi:anti-sigma regulatory factor (Ser/Thr protein kinase)
MIYQLPTIHSDKDGFAGLAGLAESAKDLHADRLEVDFSQCRFFDANLAAPLAAVLARVADRSNDIEIVNVPREAEHILRKNCFLEAYGYGPLSDTNHTTLPFVRMHISDQRGFAAYLQQHMNGKGIPTMSEALSKRFRQSIFEIFQNCVIHSNSQLGVFVCGQFFPRLKRLDLTISDAGVGIRTNVRRHLRDNKVTSIGAIRWALKQGNTTKTGNQPGGMGLKLLKDFIELNKGKIQIISRQGFYQFTGRKEIFEKISADFPGTTVNLEINTSDNHSYRLSSEVTLDDIF